MINHNKFYKDLNEALLQEGPSGKELEKIRVRACKNCNADITGEECGVCNAIKPPGAIIPPYKAAYGSVDDFVGGETIMPRPGYRSGQELELGATNDVRDEEEVVNPPPKRRIGTSLGKTPPLKKTSSLDRLRTPRLGKTWQ